MAIFWMLVLLMALPTAIPMPWRRSFVGEEFALNPNHLYYQVLEKRVTA
jgi:hypothetical protein